MRILLCINWQDAANIATVLGSFFGLIGVGFVAYQLWQQRKINQADFLLKLFSEFRSYEKLFEKIDLWSGENETFINYKDDKGMIVSYFGFFGNSLSP